MWGRVRTSIGEGNGRHLFSETGWLGGTVYKGTMCQQQELRSWLPELARVPVGPTHLPPHSELGAAANEITEHLLGIRPRSAERALAEAHPRHLLLIRVPSACVSLETFSEGFPFHYVISYPSNPQGWGTCTHYSSAREGGAQGFSLSHKARQKQGWA